LQKKVISIVLNNFKHDSRVLKENISLQKAGYDVKVVALWEDNVEEFDKVQNISVHRVKLVSKNWSKNKIIQIIKYFEFLYRVIKQYKNTDILHCNDLNALPIGVVVKKFFNKDIKIVYDAHEYEINDVPNQSKRSIKIKFLFEKFLIKYADKVITVSDAIANEYVKLYGIKKPVLVLNCPFYVEIEKKDIFREKFNIPNEDIIILYQGGLSERRGILEFAELVNNKKGMSYIIMGYGYLELKIKNFCENSNNVYFHEAVSPEVLLNYTSSADIGICIEENICKSWDYALPNKMFEYMISGLVVVVGGLSEMITFVKKHNIGFVLEDLDNKEKFDNQLNLILRDYKTKLPNVKIKAKKFNWQSQEQVLIKVYKDLYEVKTV